MGNNWELYAKGKKYNKRPQIARKFFEESYGFSSTRYKSLLQLISLDLKEGNFAHARMLINSHQEEYGNENRFNVFKSYVEHDEYNFGRERNIILQNLCENNYEFTNEKLADISVQFGRTDEAFRAYCELLENPKWFTKGIFKMTQLEILGGDYKAAYNFLSLLDFNELNFHQQCIYKDFLKYINFLKGKLKRKHINHLANNYKYSRLLEKGEDSLIKHVEKHKTRRPDHNDGCLLRDINIPDLVAEAKEIIGVINPVYNLSSDKYYINMGRTIGTLLEAEMNGLCVVTFPGSNIIITMYPVILSEDFNKEGYNHVLLPRK